MKEIVITLTLVLLFELGLNSGYTIPKTELKNETADVYELQDGSSDAVRIISPKPEKPTLREIIYYHIIERPYGRPGEQKLEGPDFYETRRSFTNGHGYQFFEAESPENSSEVINPITDKIAEENAAKDDILIDSKTSDDVETEPASGPEPEIESEAIADEIIEDIKNETGKNPEADIPVTAGNIVTENPEAEIPVTAGDIVTEQKNSRNQLFGQNKQRYQMRKLPGKKDPEESIASMKQKREVDWEDLEDIPDGPTLAELNLDGLPEYLKKLIPTEQLKLYSSEEQHDAKLDVNIENEEDPKEEMDEKLEKLFDDLLADTESEVDAPKVDENKQLSKGPSTYGMNLTLGRGYVWNDLWSKDGLLYDVGDTETVEEFEKNQDNNTDGNSNSDAETNPTEDEETPSNYEEKPHDDLYLFLNLTKDKPKQPPIETHDDKDCTYNKNHEDLKPSKEITPSSAEKGKPDQNGNQEKPNSSHEKPNSSQKKPNSSQEKPNSSQEKPNSSQEKPKSSQEKDKHKDHKDLSSRNTDQEKNKRPEQKNKEDEKDKKDSKNNNPSNKSNTTNKQSDAFKDIISDELFWSWLADRTSKYLAFMKKNIEKMVAAEVEKQFISYNEKRNNKDKIDGNLETFLEANKDEITVNEKLEKGTDGPTTEKSEPTIKDDKLTIDGKKIPVTNTTNFDISNIKSENKDNNNSVNKDDDSGKNDNNGENIDNNDSENIDDTNFLKKRQDKNNKIPVSKNNTSDGEKPPVKVMAQTIYGNSVGNDKVTNIFIFYPDKDIDKKINHIHHITSGNGTFTSGPNNDITLDKRVKPDSNKKVHISNDTTENLDKHETTDEIKNSENEKEVSINKPEVPKKFEGDNIKSDKKDTKGSDISTDTVYKSEFKKEDKKSEELEKLKEKNSDGDTDKEASKVSDEAKGKVDSNLDSAHKEDTKKTNIVKEKEDEKTNETAVKAPEKREEETDVSKDLDKDKKEPEKLSESSTKEKETDSDHLEASVKDSDKSVNSDKVENKPDKIETSEASSKDDKEKHEEEADVNKDLDKDKKEPEKLSESSTKEKETDSDHSEASVKDSDKSVNSEKVENKPDKIETSEASNKDDKEKTVGKQMKLKKDLLFS